MGHFLITGGAGFIGRWTVKRFLTEGHNVVCLDNLSNSSMENIEEFLRYDNLTFIKGDIKRKDDMEKAFDRDIESCIHLAAQVNVQESLEDPQKYFKDNVMGTYNVLEVCRKNDVGFFLISTCMVYDFADVSNPIREDHPTLPKSPYASTKLAADELALSYYHSYHLPVVILRPFNIYGPFQKSNTEGGVISIFIARKLKGMDLQIYGSGNQTRDFLYVEDCADFIYRASTKKEAVGEIINAGTGVDITINDLALRIVKDRRKIKHVKHPHSRSEIPKLVCDYSKAKKLLGWMPKVNLERGINKTENWLKGVYL